MKTKILAVGILMLLIMAGCASVRQATLVGLDKARQASDDELAMAEWYLCEGAHAGALQRRYGGDPDKVAAIHQLCRKTGVIVSPAAEGESR